MFELGDEISEALEGFLTERERTLFALDRRIVLYDLTNTYFEGQCAGNAKAQKEHGIRNRFHERLEAAFAQLQAGLTQKGTTKSYVRIL